MNLICLYNRKNLLVCRETNSDGVSVLSLLGSSELLICSVVPHYLTDYYLFNKATDMLSLFCQREILVTAPKIMYDPVSLLILKTSRC